MVRTTRPSTTSTAAADRAMPCVHGLSVAIASVLGALLPATAAAQTAIVLDTNPLTDTATTITQPNGSTWKVTTATQTGANAFNSFSRFNVGAGDTVNLHVPTGSQNLINLVWDEQVSINGLLNSYRGNNGAQVGGRVFFASPKGFVVGSTGVLNVGSLSVATPRADEMLRLGAELAGTGSGAFEALLKGQLKQGDGTVSIAGRVNALDDVRIQAHAIDVTGTIFVEGGTGADKLDSAIAVNSGGSVNATRLINDGNNIVLVADEHVDVDATGTLRANGGDVLLQGNFSQDITKTTVDDGAVRVDGVINTRRTANGLAARPADAANSTGASGAVLLAGKDISVGATGVVNAAANNGQAAGDIDVEARALDGQKMGWVKAESSATIDGTLTGRNVSVTAQSTANSVWDFEKDINGVESLPALAIESVTNVMGVLGVFDVGLLSATTKATVTVAGNAVLRATDDITVKATTIADVQTKASARGNGLNQPIASISAAYGKVDADATVNVQAGAQLHAADDVTIGARTDNTVGVSSVVLTTGVQPADAAIAVSEVNADANVDVARGVVITGDAIDIRAHNENSLNTKAAATSDKDGVAGISAAATVQDINARASNSANLSGIGSLTVDATNHSAVNATAAKVAVGKDGLKMVLQQKKADLTLALFDRMTKGLGSASGVIGAQNSGSGETKPFRFGSAMGYADINHTASATLGAGTTVSATGDVTINAQVVDEGLHTRASSAVASKAKDQNGADVGLSFAIGYTRANHDAKAVVGQGAAVNADEIAVNSTVRLPLGITKAELQSLPAFFGKLEDWAVGKLNPNDTGESEELDPPDLSNPLSSMVFAKAKGEKLGIGGAVNYLHVTNNSNAWVDDGATLTARHVDVKAATDIVSVHLAGKPGIASGDRAGIGGTFNDVIYDSTTLAGIGKGATVTASGAGTGDGTVEVAADSKNITYVVAPTSGEATTLGLTGMVSIADISDTTRASVSNDAKVSARTVDVTAAQDALLVSAAGGFTQSESAAVGFTVAVNNLQSDVHAYVGDNAADAKAVTGVDHAAATATGWIATDALGVKADTTGQSVAIAIAGTLAKNDDPNKEPGEPGLLDKIQDSVKNAKKKLDDASKKVVGELSVLDKLTAKVKGGASVGPLSAPMMAGSSPALPAGPSMAGPSQVMVDGPTMAGPSQVMSTGPSMAGPSPPMAGAQAAASGDPKPQPKFGLSVSGSAAVNMAKQSTRATLDGATVKARSAGGAQDTTVQATNSAALASASGAAAITRSQAPSSKFNGAMAGAVAYGLIDNTTEASATRTSLQDADDVAIRALNAGEHTVLGISVGVEASGTATKSASFSGSFSIADTRSDTRATLDGTTVQAADIAGTGVDVTAYNRSRTGIGGGSLYVNTSTSSNANVGMAFTYAKIGGTTEAAQHGGRIDDADAVTIRAVDSALIGSAAAMGGGGANANGLAGAFIWNEIGNTTRAAVDGGAVIDVDGDIAVSARASAPVAELDGLIAGGVTDTSQYDFSGSTLFANSGETGLPGTSIVSVAGLVQAGKNNIGVSFVGSKVDNTHEVSIDGATLDAGTKKVDLKATDNTRVIAASVGVGVATGDFAGMGSATANMIGNTSRVAVKSSTITAGTIAALAQDDSKIEAFAGNVTVSKSNAAGVAIGYNAIDNTVEATVADSTLDTKGEAAAGANGAINLDAKSNATILAGAVAGAISKDVAIGGSFGWTESSSATRAEIETSTVQTGTLDVRADNDTDIKTLSGSIAVSKDAAVGAAINTVLVEDGAYALLDRVNLDAVGAVGVDAGSIGSVQSMAVAGAGALNVAVAGSNNNAAINNIVQAQAHGLTGSGGAKAGLLRIKADNQMDIDTLAGAVTGAQFAAVGGAIGVNLVGGRTSATLTESQLAVTGDVQVDADSSATIDTLSVSASGSVGGSFAGAMTTNFVTSTTEAGVRDTGSSVATSTLSVTADDTAKIQSAATAAAGGSTGIGASIAVNRIASTVDAFIEGGDDNRTYNTGEVTVAATSANSNTNNSANIRTVAVGIGGGSDVGGAGSLAVNLLDNDVKARIDNGARVTSQNNVAVLARNQQGIDVLAGAVGIGGTAAGVGLGIVVNHVAGDTSASISGAGTQVNAQALGAGRSVSNGELVDPSAVDVSDITEVADFVSPNLATGTRSVNGIAVNASSQQNIATAGGSAALSFNPLGSFAVAAIAGTNIIGGTTRATIDGAAINQLGGAAGDQQVDVTASSHAMSANFIVGAAGSGGVSATAAVAANVFASDTEASIRNAQTRANAGVNVDANASHNAVALSVGLAGGLVGGAGSVSMNVFDTRTRALVQGGALNAGSLFVEADSTNRANLIAGAGAAGGVGIAGSFLVNVGSSDTYAYVGDAGTTTTVDVAGALDVDATSHSVMKGVAVSGAAGGAAGVAGMAGVSVLANATKAWVGNATTTSNTLDVSARDTLDLSSYAGALGISSSGYGVGAAANVAVLANTTSARIVDSTTTTTGRTTVDATTERKLDAVTVTAGVGGTAGIGGAASLLLVGLGDRGDSNNELNKDGTGTLSKVGAISNGTRIDGAIGTSALSAGERDTLNARGRFDLGAALAGADDSTTASIANSTVRASAVDVDADAKLGIRHITGAAGGGGVGLGGALAYTGVYDATRATISNSAVTTTATSGNAVRVDATSGDLDGTFRAGDARAYAGGAGLVGLGAAIAIANVDRTTQASVGGTLAGASGTSRVDVSARDTSTLKADATGAAAGAAAGGIVVATAKKTSDVGAAVSAAVGGHHAMGVDARSTGAVSAQGYGASAGLIGAGTGVGVTATDETVVSAGSSGAVSLTGGDASITASATPDIDADAFGVTVAGNVGLGASVALAKANVDVNASMTGTLAGTGNLTVGASVGRTSDTADTARAKSVAGTGGFLVGANATYAEASNTSKATASTGDNARLSRGNTSVTADVDTRQFADSTGVAVGALALGASVSKATSNTTTTARIGASNQVTGGQSAGDITVRADATDRNVADVTAGAGGVVSGNAARADTSSTSNTTASIGNGTRLRARKVDVSATHDSRYAGNANSVNASVVGASGAGIGHAANATVSAGIGANADIGTVDDIRVAAQNRFHSDNAGASVSAAGGGVINGSAALVEVNLTGTTNAGVGTGARLATGYSTGNNGRDGDIHVLASTIADTADTAELSTGGAIDVAVVKARTLGTFTNNVTIGDNAALDTYGYINVGTYTKANLAATALVNTWGLAAVGVSDSDVDVISNQNVTIGSGASLEATQDVFVTAGRDSRNLHETRLDTTSTSQGYVRGLIAVPNSSAEGHAVSNANVWTKSGSDLTSTGNVAVGAYTGAQFNNVDGAGHGYQLGFIPVTQRDSTSGSMVSGTMTLDGALVAGRYNMLNITIDADGTLRQTDGILVAAVRNDAFNPKLFLDSLSGNCALDPSDGCKGLVALKNSVANQAIGAWSLGRMFAGGGDVFLHGDSINGAGSATAKGAPTITITNNSNRALLLDQIRIPDYAGGNVRFTGNASSAGSLAITHAPSTAKPTVNIHNAGSASNPGAPIFVMGDIRNIGGLVRLRNDEGSLGLFATTYAQQQIVEAPNGIVTFNNTQESWFSGSNPQSDWTNFMLRPGNANDAVVYAGISQYGSTNGLLYQNFGGRYAGGSTVLFGGCMPYADGGCNANIGAGTVGFYGVSMPGLGDLNARPLTRTGDYASNPAVGTNAGRSSFVGQQIYVRAKYIDVNSTIDAGAGTNWSLRVKPEMQGWIDALGANAQGLFDIPDGYVSTIEAGSRLIKARYDATNKRIVVDNVNASGGGYVYLDGKIVSSTPHGKIRVSSGYGKVAIDSGADLPVQVADINAGNGAVGVVEIVDRQKQADGAPWTTWYVSRQGAGTQAFDNRNGATSYEQGFLLGNSTSYSPTAGMRYKWTETAYFGREEKGLNWFWTDANGGGINTNQWATSDADFYKGTAGGHAFEQSVFGRFTSETGGADVYYHGCEGGAGSECNYGFRASWYGPHSEHGGGDGSSWHSVWGYRYPNRGYVTLNSSVKADNPIAIDFSGNAIGSVDVRARGDLFVNGRISNGGGTTSLATTYTSRGGLGHVLTTGLTGLVTTRDLRVSAGGGLGSAGNFFLATLTDNGTLDATSGGSGAWSGQYVRLLSGGAVRMRDGSFGNIVLDANGSITGLTGATRDFAGGDITLTSRFGSLGSIANPLDLEARELSFWGFKFGGRVNATALGDIGLTDHSGDFAVNKVVSTTGNVRLEAATGNLVDARQRTGGGTLDEAQRQAIWAQLKLDGSGVAASVAAYEKQVATRYNEYWRLLDVGTVNNGAYQLNADAIALFRPLAEAAAGRTGLTDAEINAYAAGRYADAGTTFDAAFGASWRTQAPFQSRQANFAYTLDPASAQYADLSKNSTWTQGQLKYAINANALEPASGAVGQADPNVQGRNVTLVARDNVGRLAADRSIAYTALTGGTLNDDEAIALALANAPGDVVLVRGDGHVYTRAELLALTPAQIAAGAIANVRVKQTSPLFVQLTGVLDGSAGQAAFLQANGDLAINRFTTGGDARMAATGSIVSGRSDPYATLKVGGDLVLLAGNGRIGASASSTGLDPLVTEIGGRLLSASAGQDVRLRDDNGDLQVGTVFANGTIGLESQYGDVVSVLDGVTLDGQSIELKAAGAIGHRKAATGALEGALKLRVAGSGTLAGSAGGTAWIDSPDRDLHVGTFTAGRDLRVTASLDDLTADDVTAGDELVLGAGGDLVVGTARGLDSTLTALGNATVGTLDARNATLNAGDALRIGTVRATGNATLDSGGATTLDASGLVRAANVDIGAASLGMGAGSRIESSGDIAIDTTGDMVLGALVLTGNASGNDVALDAGGRIDGNGDGQVNVRGGRNTALSMQAGRGIGTRGTSLTIDIGRTTGRATSGDIHLQLPSGGRIDSLIADAGDIGLGAGGALDLGLVQAFGGLRIDGSDDLLADTLIAGTDLSVDAAGDVVVTDARAGRGAAVNSGGDTVLDTLQAGRDATLVAGGALEVRDTQVGNDLTATSGGRMGLDTADVGFNARLQSASDIALRTLRAGGTLQVDAGGGLDADDLAVGGDARLDAAQGIALGTASIGGALVANAGLDLVATQLDVTGNASLDAGQDVTLGTASFANALKATAGRTIAANHLDVDGNASLDARRDISLGTATIDGDLAGSAGRDFDVATLHVGGNASIDAGNMLRIVDGTVANALRTTSGSTTTFGTLGVGGDLDARAGGALAAQQVLVGGTANLASGGDSTIDTLAVTGALTATSGANLAIATASVGGNARLDAAQGITLGRAAIGGALDADAGLDLVATQLDVTGNASLDAGRDVTLGTASFANALKATAGRTIAANQLDVEGNASLDARRDISLGTATIDGDLAGSAGRDFDVTTLDVGGNASVEAGNALRIVDGTVANALRTTSGSTTTFGMLGVGGDLDAQAGGALAAQQVLVGGTANLASVGDSIIDTLAVTGALTATSGANLAIATASVGGNARLDAAQGIALGTASIGGALEANAGLDVLATQLDVTGDASLDAGQDVTLATTRVRGNLAAVAGRDLQATQLQVGGNVDLDGRNVALGTATVGGNADVDAVDDLRATTLVAGGDIALDAGDDVTLGTARSGGRLDARAGDVLDIATAGTGRDATLAARTINVGTASIGAALDARSRGAMRIDTARVGTDATLRAGDAMTLGTVATGNDLDAVATRDLRFASLDGGRDVLLESTGGDVIGGSARAGRHLRIKGARRVDFDALRAGSDASITAGADVDGDLLQAGRDINVQAGTDIALRDVEGGRAVALDAGEAMRLDRVRAGTDLSLASGADMGFGTLEAGRNIALRSRRGDVTGDALRSGGDASLTAARDLRVGTATVGGALAGTAGRDLSLDRYDVRGAGTLQSGRDMRIGTGTSGGAQSLLVGGSLGFGTLSSDTALALDAAGGRIDGSLLIAPAADVSARDAIDLDMARIGKRLNMASASIDANVQHTGAGMLATRLTGYRDGVARRIDLSVDARDGWLMEKLSALQADLDTTAAKVSIDNGFIGQTMRLDTPAAKLWMDNTGAILRMADVQFLELDKRFRLFQTGVHTLTDAYVVRFSPGFRVEVPNYVAAHDWRAPNYLGESAVRFTTRTLTGAPDVPAIPATATGDDEPAVVEAQGGAAVNIGAAP